MDISVQIPNGTNQVVIQTSDTLTDIGIQLGATLAGAFFGFIFAILIEMWKKKKDILEDKINLIDLLYAEITKMKGDLENPKLAIGVITWIEKDHKFSGNYGLASLPVVQSSINSGHFLLLSPKLQFDLSTLNDRVGHYNWFIKQILSFYISPIYTNPKWAKREALNLIGYVEEQQKKLLEDFSTVIKELESERFKTKTEKSP